MADDIGEEGSMVDPEWIIGRKEIMAALHVNSWRTVVRWKHRYGLDFVRMPNGKPALLRVDLNAWLARYKPKFVSNLPTL